MKNLFIAFIVSPCLVSCMQEQSWWPQKHHTSLKEHDHKHSKQHTEEEKLPGHHHAH